MFSFQGFLPVTELFHEYYYNVYKWQKLSEGMGWCCIFILVFTVVGVKDPGLYMELSIQEIKVMTLLNYRIIFVLNFIILFIPDPSL